MLRTTTAASIDGLMKATGWQQHSVRGFLAGVVRKRLGLKLESAIVDGQRVYRVVRLVLQNCIYDNLWQAIIGDDAAKPKKPPRHGWPAGKPRSLPIGNAFSAPAPLPKPPPMPEPASLPQPVLLAAMYSIALQGGID